MMGPRKMGGPRLTPGQLKRERDAWAKKRGIHLASIAKRKNIGRDRLSLSEMATETGWSRRVIRDALAKGEFVTESEPWQSRTRMVVTREEVARWLEARGPRQRELPLKKKVRAQ